MFRNNIKLRFVIFLNTLTGKFPPSNFLLFFPAYFPTNFPFPKRLEVFSTAFHGLLICCE